MRKVRAPLDDEAGFSLVEVVLALGLFAFAMVAMLGLLGTSIKGVRMLEDRDGLVTAGGAAVEPLARLTRDELTALPTGTDAAAGGRPTFYGYIPSELHASEAGRDVESFRWTNSVPQVSEVKGPRVFRVRVYRAMRDAGSEQTFNATNISFPVRIVVEALAPGQSDPAPGAMSWSFHRIMVPVQ